MTELLAKQQYFAFEVARLIAHAAELGYGVTLGEAWRSPETAKQYARQQKGIANSLHCIRLAIDINLFKGEKLLNSKEDYEPLGTWWGNLSPDHSWGGDFGDIYHFSVKHGGVR